MAIAAAVTAAQIGGTYASTSWNPHHGTAGNATYVALAVGGASLIARRRYPVGVLAVALATALWAGVSGHAGLIWLALIVAFFNAVLARKRAAAIASLLIGYAVSMWPPWLIDQRGHPSAASALGLAVFLLFMLSIAEAARPGQRLGQRHRRHDRASDRARRHTTGRSPAGRRLRSAGLASAASGRAVIGELWAA